MINRILIPGDEASISLEESFFARIDRAETIAMGKDDGKRLLVFDAVVSSWFLDNSTRERGDMEYFARSDVRLLYLEIEERKRRNPQINNLVRLADEIERKGEPANWWRIELRRNKPRARIVQQPVEEITNLYAPGQTRYLRKYGPVDSALSQQLDSVFNLDDVPDATEEDVKRIVGTLPSIERVMVYDVGQGNCSSLCDSAGVPQCYFDFGGGIGPCSATFPPGLTQFCFSASPFILLSHWDGDHWSSANRDSRARNHDWLAPRQNLRGPTQLSFAATLHTAGKLHILPPSILPLKLGQLEIEQCTGSGMNHSGLALVLHEHRSGSGAKRILFPGDASYHHIPSHSASFTSIVAPHHGADSAVGTFTPPSPGNPESRLAFSYGSPNRYGHPGSVSRSSHTAKGWTAARDTTTRNSSGFGHLALGWAPITAAPLLACSCGSCPGICQLAAQQT